MQSLKSSLGLRKDQSQSQPGQRQQSNTSPPKRYSLAAKMGGGFGVSVGGSSSPPHGQKIQQEQKVMTFTQV